jgi:hypothetical protein
MASPVAESDVRTFKIVGGSEVLGQKTKGSRKRAQQLGGSEIATAGVVPLAVKTPVTAYRAPNMGNLQGPPISAAFQPLLSTGGGNGNSHTTRTVHLQKSSGTVRRVQLNPKKMRITAIKGHKAGKTRKITLGLPNLHRRITRARRIRKDIDELPIAELRQKLIGAGLVRATTKAPESVLRQIAADAHILGEKSL